MLPMRPGCCILKAAAGSIDNLFSHRTEAACSPSDEAPRPGGLGKKTVSIVAIKYADDFLFLKFSLQRINRVEHSESSRF